MKSPDGWTLAKEGLWGDEDPLWIQRVGVARMNRCRDYQRGFG
jgi:hypothetical protein